MASVQRAAAIFDDAPEHADLAGVERVFAHCRGVVDASRTLHAAWWGAGFDAQVAEPVDPDALEQILSRLLRPAA